MKIINKSEGSFVELDAHKVLRELGTNQKKHAFGISSQQCSEKSTTKSNHRAVLDHEFSFVLKDTNPNLGLPSEKGSLKVTPSNSGAGTPATPKSVRKYNSRS